MICFITLLYVLLCEPTEGVVAFKSEDNSDVVIIKWEEGATA